MTISFSRNLYSILAEAEYFSLYYNPPHTPACGRQASGVILNTLDKIDYLLSLIILSINFSNEMLTAFAILGTRLVEVIPGSVFTSRQ